MLVRRSLAVAVLVCLLLVGAGMGLTTAAPAPSTLRVSYLQRILSLDPHGSAGAERMSWIIGRHLYNQLVSWDYTAKKFQPQLALRWRNVDPTTWEFELRRGVKFHDGKDFTSASVKTSLERVVAMKGPLAPLFAPVQSVETPDPYRVIVKTREPVGTLLSNLTILAMVPAGTPPTPDFGDHPVGTGPFKFAEFVRDARLVLDANPNYWQQGIPKSQHVIFVDIPEVAARATAVETGEIDIAVGLPPEQMKRLRTIQNVKVDVGATTLTRALWINAERPPFSDVRVRHALQHAINVNAITSSLVAGIATPSTSSIASNVVCYAKMPSIAYDTTLARKLLAEAGFPRGFDTSIKWTEGNPKEREVSDAIVGQLALVGIRVRNMQQPRAIWLDDLLKLNWDFEISTTGGGTGDPDFTLRRLYHTRSKRTGWSNQEFDKLVDDAAASVNLQQRCAMYKRAQEIIWDQGPAVFLFDPLESYAYRTRVQGFTAPPSEIFGVADVAVSP
jgi:peptide/nickel transport system substrate-binding protein